MIENLNLLINKNGGTISPTAPESIRSQDDDDMMKNFNMPFINLPVIEDIYKDGFDGESAFYRCSKCGEEFEEDELTVFDDRLYCEECIEEYTVICECCGKRVYEDMTESDCNITICKSCAAESYSRCSVCDCLICEDEEEVYEDAYGNYFCYDCYESRDALEVGKVIHERSYKPEPIFHSKQAEDKNRFFGAELETDRCAPLKSRKDSDEIAKAVLKITNENTFESKLYAKNDQSLKYGFELVSHPMTLAYHQHNMPWANIMSFMRENGYISGSSDTCGLHFHVNRSSLGDTEEKQAEAITKILIFVENNWNEILKFSRRTEAQMNRWAARYDIKEHGKLKEIAKKKNDSYKFTCVNLKNTDTIEFRMFKGTLNYRNFAAAMQFVNAVCDIAVYCSDKEVNSMSWSDFSERINAEKDKYTELISYLKEKNIYLNLNKTEENYI